MKIATGVSTFRIDTGSPTFQNPTRSSSAEGGLDIRFTDWTRADREKRKIIEVIVSCETPNQVTEYYHSENLLIDALFLFDDTMVAEIKETANDHIIILGGPHGLLDNR